MKKIFLLLALLVLTSCAPKVEVTKEKGILRLSNIQSKIIDKILILPWKVGKKREAEVSMGFIMKVEIPKFASGAIKTLTKDYPIDSWAFKIFHTFRGRKTELGRLYLPFNKTFKTTDSFSLRIFYHAAAVSDRFRKFSCPAFGHRKIISDYEILETKADEKLYVRPSGKLIIKNYALDHIPVVFSKGLKLAGVYSAEVALYSKSESKRYSQFINIGNKISITNEDIVKVNSCIGVREEIQPLPTSRRPRIEDMQIR